MCARSSEEPPTSRKSGLELTQSALSKRGASESGAAESSSNPNPIPNAPPSASSSASATVSLHPNTSRGSQALIILSTRGAGEDTSIGTYAAPTLSTPNIAAIAVGDFGNSKQTRSPRRQPLSPSSVARRLLSSSSSP